MIDSAYHALYLFALLVLTALLFLCFLRALHGPTIADRIVSINMMGTQIIAIICILGLMLREGYLADVAIIYAMISFLSVVVLCKVYLGVYWRSREKEAEKHGRS